MRRYKFEVLTGHVYDDVFGDYITGENFEEALLDFIYWMEDHWLITDYPIVVLVTDMDDDERNKRKFLVYSDGSSEEVNVLSFNDVCS